MCGIHLTQNLHFIFLKPIIMPSLCIISVYKFVLHFILIFIFLEPK